MRALQKMKNRKLAFETLEAREMLSVSAVEFDDIRAQYADLELTANMNDYNVIEITAAQLSDANLRNAISTAGTTTKDDLIVVRTNASQNKINLSGTEFIIDIDAATYGSVNIVSLGTDALTLDANQQSRVFLVGENTEAGLAGLNIVNGVAIDVSSIEGQSGGGIYNRSDNLIVTSSTLTANVAFFSGGGIGNSGTLTIANSTLTENTTFANGGGIGNSGTLILTNSTLTENSSHTGGGIDNFGMLTVTNSTLTKNSASNGGGIGNSGTLIVTNSTLTENSAVIDDGNKYGGGILNTGGTVTVTNSTLTGNSALSGGGIYNFGGTLNVTNSTLAENSVTHYGGGISNSGGTAYGSGTFTVTSSILTGNSADSGGGIYNYGTFTVMNSTLIGNSADSGGGIYNLGIFTVMNSTLIGNFADSGGGIYSYDSYESNPTFSVTATLNVTNSTLIGNSANSGGGIYDYGTFTLTNSTLAENSADLGGGIYGTGKLYNTIVVNNSSDIYQAYGTISGSHNLIGNDSGQSAFVNGQNGNIVGTAENPIDPMSLFVDAENGDYRLILTSLAVDGGSNEWAIAAGLNETSLDMAGKLRFRDTSIDIGAYEVPAFSISQLDVFNGTVEFSWGQYIDTHQSVRLLWMSEAATTVLGTFAAEDNFSWNTAEVNDGTGKLLVEYLDTNNNIILNFDFDVTVINDPAIAIHRGTITATETWANDKVHLVYGKLDVENGASVNITNNTVVKFWSNSYIYINTGSTLNVNSGVIFTRVEDVSIGGDINKDGNLTVPKNGNAYYRGTGHFNIDSTVEQKYLIHTLSGTISQNETWLTGNVYHVIGSILIASGVTLTIEPGAIIKFNPNCSLTVNSGATLIAEGTVTQPIIFTSIKDDAYGGDTNENGDKTRPQGGDWVGIWVSGTANFKYSKLYYGGPVNERGIVQVQDNGIVNLDFCEIAHAKYDGLWNWGGVFNVSNTIFTDLGMATAPYKGTQTFTNCTFANVSFAAMYWSHWTGTATYTNSVFYNTLSGWIDSQGSNAYQTKLTFENCVFWNPQGKGQQTFSAVGSNGNIWADPMFRDVVNGDYHLRAGSPLIDAADSSKSAANDISGVVRVNDPYTTDKRGTPDANGIYADIGAYEFTDNASSSVDLEPVDLKVPASVTVGETITIQWTIRNNGSDLVSGSWTDLIQLVSDTGQVVNVGEVGHSGYIIGGDLQTYYANVVVPSVAEGNWKFAIQANVNRNIFEGVLISNNLFNVATSTAVAVPLLTEKNGNLVTSKNNPALYKINIAAGETFYFTASSSDPISIRLSENNAPTATASDYIASTDGKGNYTLCVPADSVTRTVYLLVSAERNNADVAFSIKNETLGIAATSTSNVSNKGTSTIAFIGGGFDSTISVALKLGGTTIDGTALNIVDGSNGSAQFNLQGVAAGTYNLVVTKGGQSVTLDNAVTVKADGVGAKLSVSLDIPDSVRAGRIYTAYCIYTNTGDSDALIPVFTIKSETGVPLGLTADALTANDEIHLIGVGSASSAGVLRPGETGKVTFYFMATTNNRISLSTWADDNEVESEIFMNDYWTTWAEFHNDLSATATQLGLRGYTPVSYTELATFTQAQKRGDDTTGLSGHLRNPNTGEALENVTLVAQWIINGEETGIDIAVTNENGFYVFNHLPANNNITLSILNGAYDLSATSITLSNGNDITNYNLTAKLFGVVSGRIVDAKGIGVADISVFATSENGHSGFAVTDSQGRYTITDLELDTYSVSVGTNGKFKNVENKNATIVNNLGATNIDFNVDAGQSVYGKIVNSSNQPLSNVLISFHEADGNSITAITDENGNYNVSGLNAGEVTINISAEGYAIVRGITQTITDSTTLTYNHTLNTASIISGIVSNARTDSYIVATGINEQDVFFTHIEEDGLYVFDELNAGTWTLTVYSSSNNVNQEITVSVTAGQELTQDLTWATTAALYGTVKDINGNIMSGVDVVLQQGENFIKTMTTSTNGTYSFIELPAGSYTLSVVGTNQTQTITVAGSSISKDITLNFTATVTGTLDAENAEIQVFKDNKYVGSIYTDVTGQFKVYLNETGTYSFYASSQDNIFIPQENVVVTAGSNIELDMAAGTRSATISTSGLSSGTIYYMIGRTDNEGYIIESINGETDSTTGFNITGLIEGDYKLIAVNGNSYAETTLTITSADVTSTLNFTQKSTLKISVELPSDADISETWAWLYDSANELIDNITVDENGKLNFAYLENGTYTLVVLNGQYAAKTTITIDELSESETITLSQASVTITGTVTINGVAAASGYVLVEDSDGVILGISNIDESGNYILYILAASTTNFTVILLADKAEMNSQILTAGQLTYTLGTVDVNHVVPGLLTVVPDKPQVANGFARIMFEWLFDRRDRVSTLRTQYDILEAQATKLSNDLQLSCCFECASAERNNYLKQNIQSLLNKLNSDIEQLKTKGKQIAAFAESAINNTIDFVISFLGKVPQLIWTAVSVIDLGVSIAQDGMPDFSSFNGIINSFRQIVDRVHNLLEAAKAMNKAQMRTTISSLISEFNLLSERIKQVEKGFVVDETVWYKDSLQKSIKDIPYKQAEIAQKTKNVQKKMSNVLQRINSVLRVTTLIAIASDLYEWDNSTDQFNAMENDIQKNLNKVDALITQAKKAEEDGTCCDGSVTVADSCHCKEEPPENDPKTNKSCSTPQSCDPNEIAGPVGYDFDAYNSGTEEEPMLVITSSNWVNNIQQQKFTVFFENKSSATAAAQEVFVTMILPQEFDYNTLSLGEINIGGQIFTVAENNSTGTWYLNQTSTGEKIKVTVTFNESTRELKWYLRSYVANTVDNFPIDAYSGFLPPNDETDRGQAYVSFNINLLNNVTTDTIISTSATIVFDTNEPITTNIWKTTIDANRPESSVIAFVSNKAATQFEVDWSGTDVGSGVASYDIYVSDNGGAFELWLPKTTDTSGLYFGTIGHTYSFYSIAYDNTGLAELKSSPIAEATVTVTHEVGALDTPENLRTQQSAKTTLALDWNTIADATQYELQRKTDDGSFVTVYTGINSDFVDSGLTANTQYIYQVRAFNASGSSVFSDEFVVTTLGGAASHHEQGFIVDIPMVTNINVDLDSNKTTLTWSHLGDDYSYYVFRNGSLVSVAQSGTSYVDNNPSETVRYLLYAYHKPTGQWSKSLPIVQSRASIKSEIVSHSITPQGGITLNWNIPDSQQFVIFRNGIPVSGNVSGQSWTDTMPRNGDNQYTLYVNYKDEQSGRYVWTYSKTYVVQKPVNAQAAALPENFWSFYDLDLIDDVLIAI